MTNPRIPRQLRIQHLPTPKRPILTVSQTVHCEYNASVNPLINQQ